MFFQLAVLVLKPIDFVLQLQVLADKGREVDQQFLVAPVVVEQQDDQHQDAQCHDGRNDDCNDDCCIHHIDLRFYDLLFAVQRYGKLRKALSAFRNSLSAFRKTL